MLLGFETGIMFATNERILLTIKYGARFKLRSDTTSRTLFWFGSVSAVFRTKSHKQSRLMFEKIQSVGWFRPFYSDISYQKPKIECSFDRLVEVCDKTLSTSYESAPCARLLWVKMFKWEKNFGFARLYGSYSCWICHRCVHRLLILKDFFLDNKVLHIWVRID